MSVPSSAGSGEDQGSEYVLQGDPAKRITVQLPRSLPELQYHANRNFARDGSNAKMFHHGHSKIHQPHHVNRVKDGDVIVVEGGPRKRMPGAPGITTHMADYVPHDLEARAPPRAVRSLPPGGRFEGKTSYCTDFVEHPMEPRKAFSPGRPNWNAGRQGETGKSMYTSHYPRHELEPRPAVAPAPANPFNSAPFEGSTSYTNDYVKHPLKPRSPTVFEKPRGETGPFQGSTTYGNDYQKYPHQMTGPPKLQHPSIRLDGAPFEGNTEYGREYVPLEFERRPIVHLEPEIRRFKTSSGPLRRSRG
mmetsp:Transcript_37022/g.105825  ORF Transcript_37022/g.105825 Transcript_37022/m.105825 type:complete len:304 (+) Transcript_37022:82-993(+)